MALKAGYKGIKKVSGSLKFKNGVLSDEGSSGGGVNYSTDEQNTGVKWIDNKDIYSKTYYVETPTAGMVIDTLSSADSIVEIKGTLEFTDANGVYMSTRALQMYFSDSIYCAVEYNKTNHNLVINKSSANRFKDIYVTVYYTKS